MKKKNLIILIIILLLIALSVPIINKKYNQNNKKDRVNNTELLIQNILDLSVDTYLEESFLYWIKDNYGYDAIVKLNKIISENKYNDEVWHDITNNSYIVLKDLYLNKYNEMSNIIIIDKNDTSTLSFIGDVSLADNWYIAPKYDEREKGIYGILSEDIVDILKISDISVANSEFTVSDRGEKMPGKYYTFRASPKRLPIYKEMGIDLVTLANNHVYDFGSIAFNDMLKSLDEYSIPNIGAGHNINEAKEPYYFIINGYKIAFVNANRSEKIILTPGATDTNEGVFRCYDPTNFINLIKETKQESDFVIALIHWGREDSHSLEQVQIDTSKQYIDAGADIIIGTHAHVLQGIDFYNDKPIIYNLGDFIFNNETKDTGIFQIKLDNNGNMTYFFIPALQKDEYTSLLTGNEKQRVINDINSWSISAYINESGEILKKEK